jgi:hypothetical protein
MEPTVLIEKDKRNQNIYWLREEHDQLPFAYVELVDGLWWLGGLPACAGYFPTRNAAISAAL